jgi:hypothetical protein
VSPALDLTLEPPSADGHYRPGDWVRGRVSVLEGGGSRSLSVWLHYRERTRDYSATARREGGAELGAGELTGGTSFEFAIALPADALPCYSSPNGELWWEVEAKSDEPGRDTIVQQRIEVGPR